MTTVKYGDEIYLFAWLNSGTLKLRGIEKDQDGVPKHTGIEDVNELGVGLLTFKIVNENMDGIVKTKPKTTTTTTTTDIPHEFYLKVVGEELYLNKPSQSSTTTRMELSNSKDTTSTGMELSSNPYTTFYFQKTPKTAKDKNNYVTYSEVYSNINEPEQKTQYNLVYTDTNGQKVVKFEDTNDLEPIVEASQTAWRFCVYIHPVNATTTQSSSSDDDSSDKTTKSSSSDAKTGADSPEDSDDDAKTGADSPEDSDDDTKKSAKSPEDSDDDTKKSAKSPEDSDDNTATWVIICALFLIFALIAWYFYSDQQGQPIQRFRRSMGAPQMGAPQMGAPQMGAPQMGAPQMGAPQMGAPQMGPQF
jgi:hypothetical protein